MMTEHYDWTNILTGKTGNEYLPEDPLTLTFDHDLWVVIFSFPKWAVAKVNLLKGIENKTIRK